MPHRKFLLLLCFALTPVLNMNANAACGPADLQGTVMPADSAVSRTLMIGPQTESVNVDYGETIRFVIPSAGVNEELTWRFDGISDKLSLRALGQSPSASAGASTAIARRPDVAIYVNQGKNPMRSCD